MAADERGTPRSELMKEANIESREALRQAIRRGRKRVADDG